MTTEPTAIDACTATALIAAAAGSVSAAEAPNPSAWERAVMERAVALLRLVPALVERSEVLAACQPVRGVITKVEEVKGRGLITSQATMGNPQRNQEVDPQTGRAIEHFRTAWLNEAEGRALYEQARSLIGHHCRFGKRIETGTDAAGEPLKVRMVEWIEDLGPDPAVNGAANGAQGRQEATNPPQRSNGAPRQTQTRPAPPSAPAALPSRDDVQARAREAEQAEAERLAAGSVDWFVASGWRDQAACETARAALVARVEAAPPGAGLSFNAWVTARGWRWEDQWTAEETALASARLDEMVRNASQAERVLVGGGAPVYEPDQEPF